jgi:hypothetical protein
VRRSIFHCLESDGVVLTQRDPSNRWSNLYSDRSLRSPFLDTNITVEYPEWFSTSLVEPFRAVPSSDAAKEMQVTFKEPVKLVPRLFRQKHQDEIDEVGVTGRLALEFTTFLPIVSDYIAAIDVWRRRKAAAQPHATNGSNTAVDHQREALLHQCVVICNDVKQWQKKIEPYCAEQDYLDPSDYLACRRASQVAISHVGRRQILNAVLSAWVTEDSILDVDLSSLLAQQQREAFRNARDTVHTVNVAKTLLSCGKVVQIPWTAFAFYNAAATLAIPLLSASRDRKNGSSGNDKTNNERDVQDCPRVVRVDELPYWKNADPPQHPSRSPFSTPSTIFSVDTPAYSIRTTASNDIPSTSKFVLSMEEMRTLAPDILRIIEILPHYRTSLLSIEARHRLTVLVDTYGISTVHVMEQEHDRVEEDINHIQGQNWETQNTESAADGADGASMWSDSRCFNVLDSLVALDDTWWEQLLSWEIQAGSNGESHVIAQRQFR